MRIVFEAISATELDEMPVRGAYALEYLLENAVLVRLGVDLEPEPGQAAPIVIPR